MAINQIGQTDNFGSFKLAQSFVQDSINWGKIECRELLLNSLRHGINTNRLEKKNQVASLTAELYVKATEEMQRDILLILLKDRYMLSMFSRALQTNLNSHLCKEKNEKGSSNPDELRKEKAITMIFSRYIVDETYYGCLGQS